MKNFLLTMFIVVFTLSYSGNVKACTTFSINDNKRNIVLGGNIDFPIGYGHVNINKRNLKKTALILPPEKQITWVSKFGSITFNQAGKELPYGGMNEAGLVIQEMLLPSNSKYPDPDERFGLTALQWIQYQLDSSETVQDVIKSDSIVRVAYASLRKSTLHFLACDRYGNTAVIEYIDGKMRYYMGAELLHPVLANHTYEESLSHLKKYADFGGSEALPKQSMLSLDRFAIAASMVQSYQKKDKIVAYAFSVLDNVSQGEPSKWPTQWSIVYDVKSMKIYYKTAKNSLIRKVALRDFDFGCKSPSLFVDIDKDVDGRSGFVEYSTQANRELIARVNFVPKEGQERIATYPETIKCMKASESS